MRSARVSPSTSSKTSARTPSALFNAVNGADVRVIQRGEHPRLALEARAPVGLRRERRRQDFDRHLAPKRLVVRAVDLAHSANAEQ